MSNGASGGFRVRSGIAVLSKLFVEHHRGDDETDGGDDLPDALLWDALRKMRTQKITGQRAGGHYKRFRPVDQSGEDEIDRRHLVDERTEDGLEAVNFVN